MNGVGRSVGTAGSVLSNRYQKKPAPGASAADVDGRGRVALERRPAGVAREDVRVRARVRPGYAREPWTRVWEASVPTVKSATGAERSRYPAPSASVCVAGARRARKLTLVDADRGRPGPAVPDLDHHLLDPVQVQHAIAGRVEDRKRGERKRAPLEARSRGEGQETGRRLVAVLIDQLDLEHGPVVDVAVEELQKRGAARVHDPVAGRAEPEGCELARRASIVVDAHSVGRALGTGPGGRAADARPALREEEERLVAEVAVVEVVDEGDGRRVEAQVLNVDRERGAGRASNGENDVGNRRRVEARRRRSGRPRWGPRRPGSRSPGRGAGRPDTPRRPA